MRRDLKQIDKDQLTNLAKPDYQITHLRGTDNKLHSALTNIGSAIQSIIQNNFPAPPTTPVTYTISLPLIQVVADDILDNPHRVVLPTDPTGNWVCNSVTLTGCLTTLKIPSASGPFVMDILVKQNHLSTDIKSLFQTGFSPTVPEGFEDAHNVKFAINTLYNYDKFFVNVTSADGTASGVDCLLLGYYNWVAAS